MMPNLSMEAEQKRSSLFYGWIIVAVSFVTLALAYGARYCFSVFYVAILDEFGWPRGTTAAILSLNLVVYAFSAPLAGTLVDRYGSKKVFFLGGALIGLGLIACSTANTIWQFFLYFGIIVGLGISLLGTTPHNPILANWFVKKRGLAMGLALSGIGFSFMLGMLAQWFISSFGWRVSYVLMGVMIVVIVIPLTAIFQRSRPEEKGLLPDGEKVLPTNVNPQTEEHRVEDVLVVDKEWASTEWTLGRAVRTRPLWAFCCFNFLAGLGCMTVITHQVRFAVDVGFSKLLAASAFGLFGIANAAGHALGFVSDRVGREITCSIGAAGVIFAVLILLQVEKPYQVWMLYLYAIVFGAGMGLIAVMGYAAIADVFYGRHLGSITGLVITSLGIGFAIGPWLAGYLHDIFESYSVAFVMAIIAISFGLIWFWIAAPRQVRLVVGKAKGRGRRRGI